MKSNTRHKRSRSWRSVLALGVLVLAGCGAAENSARQSPSRDVWRFAIEESEGSVQYEYAMEFKRRVEARVKGDVSVVIYPYGTLGTSTQITEQLNMGVLEFAMASPGSLGKFILFLWTALSLCSLFVSSHEAW